MKFETNIKLPTQIVEAAYGLLPASFITRRITHPSHVAVYQLRYSARGEENVAYLFIGGADERFAKKFRVPYLDPMSQFTLVKKVRLPSSIRERIRIEHISDTMPHCPNILGYIDYSINNQLSAARIAVTQCYYPRRQIRLEAPRSTPSDITPGRGCALGSLFEILTTANLMKSCDIRFIKTTKNPSPERKSQLARLGIDEHRMYGCQEWLKAHARAVAERTCMKSYEERGAWLVDGEWES